MKIEVGKYYLTESGHVSKVFDFLHGQEFCYIGRIEVGAVWVPCSWTENRVCPAPGYNLVDGPFNCYPLTNKLTRIAPKQRDRFHRTTDGNIAFIFAKNDDRLFGILMTPSGHFESQSWLAKFRRRDTVEDLVEFDINDYEEI